MPTSLSFLSLSRNVTQSELSPYICDQRLSSYTCDKNCKSTELTEFICFTHFNGSLEIIQTGFRKCYMPNALDGTEDDIVCGAEDTGEASDEADFSGSS